MSRSKPLILSAALTGAKYAPWLKDVNGKSLPVKANFLARFMPITPEQVEADAVEAYDAGARFIHVHARNPKTGEQFADLEWYQDVTERLHTRCPGAVISYPTSRKGEVQDQIESALAELAARQGNPPNTTQRALIEAQIRAVALEARPDTLTSFTVPEVRMFGTPKNTKGVEEVPGWTDTNVMQAYYKNVIGKARQLGVKQEIEITTLSQFEAVQQLVDKPSFGLEGPVHIVILPGFSAGFPITRQAYETALRQIDIFRERSGLPVTVTCGIAIRPEDARNYANFSEPGKHDYKEVLEWIAEDNRVDVFRAGVEDTPVLYGDHTSNGGLIRHIAGLCRKKGIKVETDIETVRRQFGLDGHHKVPEHQFRINTASNKMPMAGDRTEAKKIQRELTLMHERKPFTDRDGLFLTSEPPIRVLGVSETSVPL